MAVKAPKQAVEPITPPDISTPGTQAIDLEDAIADQLLDSVDWQKVKEALLKKAPSRLLKWFQAQLLPTDGSPMITNEIEAIALSEGATDA